MSTRRPLLSVSLLTIGLIVGGLACTKKQASPSVPGESDLVKRGRVVYAANCVACHSSDPRKAGPLGPDVFGSSLELLEARMLHAAYPPGYAPKRKSQAMPKLPHLSADLPALHAFLNAGG